MQYAIFKTPDNMDRVPDNYTETYIDQNGFIGQPTKIKHDYEVDVYRCTFATPKANRKYLIVGKAVDPATLQDVGEARAVGRDENFVDVSVPKKKGVMFFVVPS